MAKDPAFLFYPKDWLEGTAELLPHEKGVYIDLLCYQHQKGDLPTDNVRLARLVGLSVDEFNKIWKVLSVKFKINNGRYYNERLLNEAKERKTKGHKNKIISEYSKLVRADKLPENIRNLMKFNVSNFEKYETDLAIERLTEWYTERKHFLEDANGNANASANK